MYALKVTIHFSFMHMQWLMFKIHVSAVCTPSSQSLILDAAFCFSTTFCLIFEAGSLLLKWELAALTRLAGQWALAILIASHHSVLGLQVCANTHPDFMCVLGIQTQMLILVYHGLYWVIFGAQHPNLLLLLYMTLSSMVFPAEYHATELCLFALILS